MITKKYQKKRLSLLMTVFCFILLGVSCKQSDSNKESTDPKITKLKLPPDFHAEHLYSPKEEGQGSWVAITVDNKGRLITCDQYGNLYRVTVPPVGYDTNKLKVQVELLPLKIEGDTSKARVQIGFAHGLLYAFNSLYITVNDEGEKDSVTRKSGLYRLQDTDNDDVFDKLTLMKTLEGQGEHGPHAPVLSPDGKSLYLIAGNFTELPEMDNYRLPNNWQTDNLLPLLLDPNGFGNFIKPPGGWIAKTDSVGSNWELISAGFRNPFDMAFNEDGELFTFDSDMEWDFGLPWYRPIRICNVTSGSEFGYRENNQKWSPSYPDNLPPILNIGQGSPTNVMSGNKANFPEKYRRGLFTFDWSYGIIYHIDLEAKGASYSAKAEEFISGSPLPLTDGVIGADGAMYFLTGGRKIESDLYRVSYKGNTLKNEPLASKEPADVQEARKVRRQLEAFQGQPNPAALDIAWPYLKSGDRFIRYAARLAVEHQPVAQWQERALSEKDPVALTQAMVSLARSGGKELKGSILNALMAVNYTQLTEPQQIDFLRAFELTLSRMGKPEASQNKQLISYLDDKYPAGTNELNRLLSKILAFADAPNVVSKTMALIEVSKDDDSDQKTATQSSDLILRNQQYGLDVANMLANKPPAQQIYLATVLTGVKNGWTPELREKYFQLFYKFLGRKGGNSYTGFIDEARKIALKNVPKNEFARYSTISGDSLMNDKGRLLSSLGRPQGPGRDWKLDEALQVAQADTGIRNFASGKALFAMTFCQSCHKMGGDGGSIGPDLSQLNTRFADKDILEAIINPNKEISDQYAASHLVLKDGTTIIGRLIKQDDAKFYISQNPFDPLQLREVLKKEVVSNKISDVSIMMPGLINRLNPQELQDLMSYLKSGGDENSKEYQKK